MKFVLGDLASLLIFTFQKQIYSFVSKWCFVCQVLIQTDSVWGLLTDVFLVRMYLLMYLVVSMLQCTIDVCSERLL